jgi:hypothetical protein
MLSKWVREMRRIEVIDGMRRSRTHREMKMNVLY